MIKHQLFLPLFLFCSLALRAEKHFSKPSIKKLKEHCAEQLADAIKAIPAAQQKLAQQQQELAKKQQDLIKELEQLADEQKSYTRDELNTLVTRADQLNAQLAQLVPNKTSAPATTKQPASA